MSTSNSTSRWAVIAPLLWCAVALGQGLPLDDYLRQVSHGNSAYKGFVAASEGAKLTVETAKLVFSPQLVSKLEFIHDPRDTQAPAIYGDLHLGETAEFGVAQKTPFGVEYQLKLVTTRSVLFGTDPAIVTRPDLTQFYVVPGFQISLWQNFFGRADRAERTLNEAKEKANVYANDYQARAVLADAEGRYWKLAVLRELIRVVKSSITRAQALLDADEAKIKKHLADPTDALLAESAVKGKQLELQSIVDEERSAARAFNAARSVDSDEVPEELRLPDPSELEAMKPPERKGTRGDVMAAEQGMIAAVAGDTLARDKVLPEVNVYGSIFAAGVNIRIPLEVDTLKHVRDGYAQQASSAELSLERKRFEEENDWKELTRKLSDSQARLKIALELEDVQRRKFELIQQKKAVGLTIEAQVFQYELDYLQAMQARVQLEGQILGVLTQLKLYGGVE